jgi:hypothetical protein
LCGSVTGGMPGSLVSDAGVGAGVGIAWADGVGRGTGAGAAAAHAATTVSAISTAAAAGVQPVENRADTVGPLTRTSPTP